MSTYAALLHGLAENPTGEHERRVLADYMDETGNPIQAGRLRWYADWLAYLRSGVSSRERLAHEPLRGRIPAVPNDWPFRLLSVGYLRHAFDKYPLIDRGDEYPEGDRYQANRELLTAELAALGLRGHGVLNHVWGSSDPENGWDYDNRNALRAAHAAAHPSPSVLSPGPIYYGSLYRESRSERPPPNGLAGENGKLADFLRHNPLPDTEGAEHPVKLAAISSGEGNVVVKLPVPPGTPTAPQQPQQPTPPAAPEPRRSPVFILPQ